MSDFIRYSRAKKWMLEDFEIEITNHLILTIDDLLIEKKHLAHLCEMKKTTTKTI